LRVERLVLKSALKKSSSARRGHVTFAATANVAAVESFKGLELWWRHEQLTRVRKRKAPSKNGETAGGTTGTAASSSVDGSADDGADRDLEQRTVNTDNVDGTADNARAAPPEVRPSQGLQELGNGDDHDQTGALNLNGCEGLSQKATTKCITPEPPRWHGGTLAPPPHLADLYGPTPAEQQHTRRRTRDELTPELAEKIRRNREAAFEKRKRRREQELNQLDGRLGDSDNPALRPALKRPRSPARRREGTEEATSNLAAANAAPSGAPALSEAQRRMEALRARVRAKSLDAG